jgi:putative hydrolase of the HAD superfamily
VSSTQALHVGDSPRADVAGAQHAGLRAVWMNRDDRAWPADLEPPSATIGSLTGLRRLLGHQYRS